MKKVAIIGAGLAGLTAAYELRDKAHVTVFEAEDRIGGKLRTVAFKAGPVDMGAEAYLARRQDATDFFIELGLEKSLRYPSGIPSSLYSDGTLYPMPKGTLMGIPATGDTVAGMCSPETVERINKEKDAEPIHWSGDMSVGELVEARYGSEVVEKLVDPLLGGVYSCFAHDLSISATVPRLAHAFENGARTLSEAVASVLPSFSTEAASGASDTTRPVFANFATGYHEVYEALAEKSKAEIYVDAFISQIQRTKEGKWLLEGKEYDELIMATPAPTTAMLLRTIAPDLSALIKNIRLASSAVVGFAFATDEGIPENSGVLVASNSDLDAKAFTFWSRKWPHIAERGGSVVRVSFGRLGDDALVRAPEDELVDRAMKDLRTVTGIEQEPTEVFLQRWYGGLPQLAPGHKQLIADIEEKLAQYAGLHCIGAWVHGVGVPDIIAATRAEMEKI